MLNNFICFIENCSKAQKRKYPRKQDKTKIKRTIRDFDPEGCLLFSENTELDRKSESPPKADREHEALPGSEFSMVPFSTHTQFDRLFGNTSEKVDGTCRHPVYTCKICHAEFPNNHGRLYKCLHCRRGFFTEGDLKQHIVNAKHNNLCEVCGKIFPDKYKLRKHALSHVTEKNFHCEVPGCTKAFKSPEDVKTHVKYVHAPEKRFKCAQCPRAFSRPYKYKLHVLKHTATLSPGLQPGMVEISGKEKSPVDDGMVLARYKHDIASQDNSSSFEGNLNHLFHNNFSPSFDDRLCSLTVDQQPGNAPVSTASSSIVENAGSPTVSLAEIGNANVSNTLGVGDSAKSDTLKEDSTQVSCQPTSGFPASDLATQFLKSERSNVRVSKNSIMENGCSFAKNGETFGQPFEGVDPAESYTKYSCDYCGCQFNQKETLTRHVQLHSVEMPAGQECVRCKTRFLTSTELRTHEERRPDHVLRCDCCSGKFLSICELRLHLRVNHNIISAPEAGPGFIKGARSEVIAGQHQKHVCADCGKVFTRADKLRRHAIIHSPDRPSIPCKCRESHGCMLTFYRKDSMKRHALTHTLEKPFKCDICDKTFSRQDYVSKHISHVHKRIFKHRCTLCDYGTREPKRLRIHIRSRHEIDPDTLLSSVDTNNELGWEDYIEAYREVPVKNIRNMATPDGEWPDAESKGDVDNLKVVEPLPLPESRQVTENSADDKSSLVYVGEESVDNRTLSNTMSEDIIQQCNLSPDVEELKRLLPVPGDVSITESEKDADKKDRTNKRGNEHKTLLNSLTVLS